MFMATDIKLSDEIVTNARINAKVSSRSVTEQIEHWIKIGKIAEDNPRFNIRLHKKHFTSTARSKRRPVRVIRKKELAWRL